MKFIYKSSYADLVCFYVATIMHALVVYWIYIVIEGVDTLPPRKILTLPNQTCMATH